mmetsp:Transcript_5539/g.12880  ORF Transcript_5539/g.12880 Transcript_5539/m.12880 type:complete len:221 (+) Transcript_5539:330-992(+)
MRQAGRRRGGGGGRGGGGSFCSVSEAVEEKTRSEGVEEGEDLLSFLCCSIKPPEHGIANGVINENLAEPEVGGEGSEGRPSLGPEEVGEKFAVVLRVAGGGRSNAAESRTHSCQDRSARVGGAQRKLLLLVEQRLLRDVAMLEHDHAAAAVGKRSFPVESGRDAWALQREEVDRKKSRRAPRSSLPLLPLLPRSASVACLGRLLLLLPLEEHVLERVPSV